jgi:hypothetical protein
MAQKPGGTIFAPVSKEDPKHGRWILPLVVLALVVFTFTFVNNLPAAETPTPTTSATGDRTTTTSPEEETTTTTTLAPEVVAFVSTADALAGQADTLRERAQTTNDDYGDNNDYQAAREGLSDIRADTDAFIESVDAVTADVPAAASDKWSDVTTAAAAMQDAAEKMLDGLVNQPGPEQRLTALDDFNIAAATFVQEIAAAKEAAMETAADEETP